MPSMLKSFTLSPQQYMYSITFPNRQNYSFRDFSLFCFASISLFLLPPCKEISFSVQFSYFSFSFLLQRSLEIAFLMELELTFFNFQTKLSLASICLSLFRLRPPYLLRLSQFLLVNVFLMSQSSQSPSKSSQSSVLPQLSSGEKPPSSSTQISNTSGQDSRFTSYILIVIFFGLSSISFQGQQGGYSYSIMGSTYFSLRISLKQSSISDAATFYYSNASLLVLKGAWLAIQIFYIPYKENILPLVFFLNIGALEPLLDSS